MKDGQKKKRFPNFFLHGCSPPLNICPSDRWSFKLLSATRLILTHISGQLKASEWSDSI